jgi:hypothetical protein
MELVELIGFLAAMIFFIVSIIRNIQEERRRREYPEEFEDEAAQAEQTLEDFFRSLDMKPPQKKPTPPPKPIKKTRARHNPPKKAEHHRTLSEGFTLHNKMDDYYQETRIDGRHLDISIENKFKDGYADHLVNIELQGQDVKEVTHAPTSKANDLIASMKSEKKKLILLQEIMNPPKSLQ